MLDMTSLELLADASGCIVLGWLGAGTFYARFEGTISAGLAESFAARFESLIGDSVGVHYFADSLGLAAYDLRAMGLIVDAVLAKRRQFKLITARPWQAELGPQAHAFATAFGVVEYVTVAEDFEARLSAAAPHANLDAASAEDASEEAPAAHATDSAAVATDASPKQASPSLQGPINYIYIFDLSRFEQGHFTAHRVEHLSAPSRGIWWCVASDDARALELARKAALMEWASPTSRRAEDFVVKFLHRQLEDDQAADHLEPGQPPK